MNPLSPMDAQRRLSYARKHGIHMSAGHRRAMETIAGMHEEWGVEYAGVNHGGRHTEWGYETRDEAERQARRYRLCTDMHPVRVVRRYVTNEGEA